MDNKRSPRVFGTLLFSALMSALTSALVWALPQLTLAQQAQAAEQTESAAKPRLKPEHQIEEVLVTVSKRTESVQEVSSAVTAFSEDMLRENNIQDYKSLADFTPGMVTRDNGSVSIRGIGKAFGGTSPVAFHVNGFFLEEGGAPFYDTAAIEVLRGPSGTVYGRNATAGAINAKWNTPETDWGFGGDLRYATEDDKQLRAFVNAPLIVGKRDWLLARVAGYVHERAGRLNNLLAPDDEEPFAIDEYFYRAVLSSDISDTLSLGLHAIKFKNNKPSGTVASPSIETRESGILEAYGAETLPSDLNIVRSTLYQEQLPSFEKFSRVAAELTWNLEELPLFGNVDIDVMAGVARGAKRNATDLDGTEEPIVEVIEDPKYVRRNMEIRFTSQNDTGFDWIAGIFWYRSNWLRDMHTDAITEQGLATLVPPAGLIPLPPTYFSAEVDFIGEQRVDKAEAIFLNTTFDLKEFSDNLPDIQLFAGIRENRDELRLRTARETIIARYYDIDGPLGVISPLIAPVTDLIAIPFEDTSTDVAGSFKATTGELGGKWFYNEDGMTYLKFARGYKPGTVQLLAGEGLNVVAPEYLHMLEAGWKGEFFNRTVIANIGAFYYDYTDLQVSKIIITGVKLENAGAATIKGLEFEAQWSPTPNFFSQYSFTYLDAKFQEFCGRDEELRDQSTQAGCTDEDPHNFKGATMRDSPQFKASAFFRYTFNLGEFGSLTPSLKVAWTDDYQRRPYDNDIDEIEAHTKSDVRLTWQSLEESYRAEVFVENIENHDDLFADHFSMPDPGAYSLLSRQAPRTAGMRLEYNF